MKKKKRETRTITKKNRRSEILLEHSTRFRANERGGKKEEARKNESATVVRGNARTSASKNERASEAKKDAVTETKTKGTRRRVGAKNKKINNIQRKIELWKTARKRNVTKAFLISRYTNAPSSRKRSNG